MTDDSMRRLAKRVADDLRANPGWTMPDDLRRRPTTPPEVFRLPSGDWCARRLGVAGTGPTKWHAIWALVRKEGLATGTALLDDATADPIAEGMPGILARLVGEQ
jgi:hypothetical protein